MRTSETYPVPVALGRLALFLPFVVVTIVLFATGRESPGELAMLLPLLAIPVAILALRLRAHR
jgi:hypothetical protein